MWIKVKNKYILIQYNTYKSNYLNSHIGFLTGLVNQPKTLAQTNYSFYYLKIDKDIFGRVYFICG